MRKKKLFCVASFVCMCLASCTDYADRITSEEAEGQSELEAIAENPFVIEKKIAVEALQNVLDAMVSEESTRSEIPAKKVNAEGVIVGSIPTTRNVGDTLNITRLIYGIPFTDGGYAIVPADFRVNVPAFYISMTGSISQEMIDEGIAKLSEYERGKEIEEKAYAHAYKYLEDTLQVLGVRNQWEMTRSVDAVVEDEYVTLFYADDTLEIAHVYFNQIVDLYAVFYLDKLIASINATDSTYEIVHVGDTVDSNEIDYEKIFSIINGDDEDDEEISEAAAYRTLFPAEIVTWASYLAYGTIKDVSQKAKESILQNWGKDSEVFVLNSPIEYCEVYMAKTPDGIVQRDFNFGQHSPYNDCQGKTIRKYVICGKRKKHAAVGCGAVAACAVAYQQGIDVSKFGNIFDEWPTSVSWNNPLWDSETKKKFGKIMKKIGDDCSAKHWYNGTSIGYNHLTNHFLSKYFYGADFKDYSLNKVKDMLKNNRIPIIYGSSSGGILTVTEGHYWVNTGYQAFHYSNGNTVEMVYEDFGNYGTGNGWFLSSEKGGYRHHNRVFYYGEKK